MTQQLIISGFGGQGVLSMGMLLAYAGLSEGKEVTWLPSYGPEMRGGTANCNVIISEEAIGAPIISSGSATCVIAMNRPSLEKYESFVQPGGLLLINSSIVDIKATRTDIQVVYVPCSQLANDLGSAKVANTLMLGTYLELTKAVSPESILGALPHVLGKGKEKLIPINRSALEAGAKAAR